uniref:Transposase Tc1-like domain-containing protein n=1 Tax=Oryzias latipes TaxID=8090 RepID=A0A3P9IDQ3_ORYLA
FRCFHPRRALQLTFASCRQNSIRLAVESQMLQVNLCQSVISRTTGRVCDRPRSGAPPETDHNHDQNLRTSDLRHGLANTTQLQTRLPDVKGTRVSRQTVHNRLHHFNLNDRRLLQMTPLTRDTALNACSGHKTM